ncbi:MAG TPA: ABC transporter permease [Candidatus Binatia bacterium]|nr:ABC transporter permease [Candidatus Binatia bacterium]
MLEGLIGPLRVVLQRSFADWLIVAATWLVILCATTLVAIGFLYGDAVALTGLRQVIREAPPGATTVAVQLRASGEELTEVEPAIERQLDRILAWTGGELITVTWSETYALPATGSSQDRADLALFGSYEGLERHATLTAGTYPEAGAEPMEVALPAASAERLGLAVGDVLELSSQRGSDRTIAVRIAGTWAPNDGEDPYWRGDLFEIDGVTEGSSFTTHGPFVVARPDLVARTASGDLALEVRALPDFEGLAVGDVGSMRRDTAALDRRLTDALGERAAFQISTELDTILADVGRSLLVSRSGVVVLTIQYAVLAGYALLLVAGLLVEQRRIETALIRSRGGGVGHVVLMSFLEGLALVVPAVLAAPWLAVGALNLLNVAGPLAEAGIRIDPRVDEAVWVATAVAGVAAVAGLVLPALTSGRGLLAVRQSLARQGSRSLAQRLGIDLALVALAALGLWQLRQYGAPLTETVRGEIGLDPLLVAAPAIGLLAGAIVALRLVPLSAELGERVLRRRRGLVAPLGARQVARRPLRYTRSALLLMLAAALGTFAGAYASTWTRSQADQAIYRTGSDVRVEVSGFPDLLGWAIGQAYRSVDGVETALPVVRQRFDVADGNGQLLALDAGTAEAVVTVRPDLASQPIGELLGRLGEGGATTTGIPLADEPAYLAVELSAALQPRGSDEEEGEEPENAPLSPTFPGIVPSVLVRDADGLIHRLEGGRLTVGGSDQRLVLELTGAGDLGLAPAHPLEILAVELGIQLPDEVAATGTLDLVALESSPGPDGPWSAVPLDELAWSRTDAGHDPQALGPAGPVAIESPLLGSGALINTVLRLGGASTASEPIPALAGSRLLETIGAAVGDTVDLGSLGVQRRFVIVGTLDAFPTLDPGEPLLVVDLATLAAADAAAGRDASADEWWLVTEPDRGAAVAEELRAEPYSAASVVARDDLHRDLLSDPVALGVVGSLALGALAAIVFATIGFMVSATVSTRERLGEFALLQAIGLSHRQLSGWLSMENAFLLVMGLAVGTGLGLVLAWVVLPFVTLTQEATLAVPPVEVVIPWGIYGLLYLAAAVALVVTVFVIGNLLARVRVSGVLRSGGE